MGVNFGIEYLYASVAIESPVGLPNKASFVKFESSGTLISNLKKSPLFYLCACPAKRFGEAWGSVVIILICRATGSALADPLEAEDPPMAGKTPEICRSEKDRDRKGP